MPKTNHPRTATIRARVDARRKDRVDVIFHELGMTASEAVNIFYAQIERFRGLPFDVVLPRIPNAQTLAALKEDMSEYPEFRTAREVMRSLRTKSSN